jgi:phosphomevalonate kinase
MPLILLDPLSHSTSSQSRNKFVETALAYALTYASAVDHTKIGPASITILADTDYYSHRGTPGSSSSDIPSTTDQFLDFYVPLHEAHKTGLGSSAALVTALTAAVVAHYAPREVVDMKSTKEKFVMHNLAQAAHCAAQGKVGSGFDVAAATYGSCIYKRFSPSILQGLGEIGSKDFSMRLRSLVEAADPSAKWDTDINKDFGAIVPSGLRLLMCDVDCGSETVGMVKKVLSWRNEQPEEALTLWETLQKGNEDLAAELNNLASRPNSTSEDYENLRDIILTVRSLIRKMSAKSGVPIEPKAQTTLIDALSQLPGVVGGVVPGAGGFDAIALLVEDKEPVIEKLSQFLQKYRVDEDASDGVSIRNVRLLDVKQVNWGLKKEDSSNYRKWLQ